MSDIAISADSPARSPLATEVARRRTFAIISHPDAGKTTLTEKLLLFGGAINLAGQVKAKGERRNTRSDWMKIERERGISVVTSVMTFEFEGLVFNLLDTPGHEDFSEDTYRTLTAVDSAVMVIDAAKGIEARTRKLFEVCRLRDIPIITFINKMDRESRDVFELLDEIEKTLALDTTPMTWPVGRGRDFLGTYDVANGGVRLLEGGGAKTGAAQQIEIAELAKLNANLDVGAVKDELELVLHRSDVEVCIELGQLRDLDLLGRAGLGATAFEQAHAAIGDVIGAEEVAAAADRPGHRRGVERQRLLDLVEQLEDVAALAVHLVDEGDDRDIPKTTNLEQLSGARLDALGSVDHHDSGVDRRERTVGVLRKVLMARRVQQIEHKPLELEGHDRGHDRDAALALDLHPVRTRVAPLALGLDLAGEIDGTAEQQQLLGQRGLARVRVGDDREGAPPRHLGGKRGTGRRVG